MFSSAFFLSSYSIPALEERHLFFLNLSIVEFYTALFISLLFILIIYYIFSYADSSTFLNVVRQISHQKLDNSRIIAIKQSPFEFSVTSE